MARVTEGEIEETVTDGGAVYGVRVSLDDGRCLRLRDVDTDRLRVERLLCRIMGEPLDETQLRYLAEDLLGAAYDGSRS